MGTKQFNLEGASLGALAGCAPWRTASHKVAVCAPKLLARSAHSFYSLQVIIIRFPDDKAKRRALGFLPGRFCFKSWATGEMMAPESALPALAVEGIRFGVEGPAAGASVARERMENGRAK